jgi:hypothetical protein
VKSSYRLIFLLAGAFVLGVAAGNGVSLRDSIAQGYDGLITAPEGKASATQAPGYKGLIPGYVPEDEKTPAQEAQQKSRIELPKPTVRLYTPPDRAQRETVRMTNAPGYTPPSRPRTIDDIRIAALAAPRNLKWEEGQIPPQIDKTITGLLSPRDKDILSVPKMRVGGMLPKEYLAKQNIDRLMSFVTDPKLSDDERKANAKKARDKLVSYANYLNDQAQIPSTIYQKMGLPAVYMKESKEASDKSLARVEAALKELKKYQ